MKFRYIGQYPEGQDYSIAYGVEFRPGVEVEVPAEWESTARGNRFFEPIVDDAIIIDDDAPEAWQSVPETEEPEPADDASEVSGMSKAELIAIADGAGIQIDRRWSASRISEAIKAGKQDNA